MRNPIIGLLALSFITVLLVAFASDSARAHNCPGSPDALGTSRVLAIDPREYPRVGAMEHAAALPLTDKEVVLTFDDGPVPRYSNQVLDILAAQCVKATFFSWVKWLARILPRCAGFSRKGTPSGTHTEDHPLRFGKLPAQLVEWEIDKGIIDVGAALGDPKEIAPFFRAPGLARSDVIESELAARLLRPACQAASTRRCLRC